jgi:hypothetical protein
MEISHKHVHKLHGNIFSKSNNIKNGDNVIFDIILHKLI